MSALWLPSIAPLQAVCDYSDLNQDSEHVKGLLACWPMFRDHQLEDVGPKRFARASRIGTTAKWAPGPAGDAMAYRSAAAASNYINTGVTLANLGIDHNTPFSWCMWAYVNSASIMFHATQQNNTNPYRGVQFLATTTDRTRFDLNSTINTSEVTLDVLLSNFNTVGRWTRWCLTYDGSGSVSGLRAYADGREPTRTETVSTLSGSIQNSNSIIFSSRAAAGFWMNGALCDFRIYDYALPPALAREVSHPATWDALYRPRPTMYFVPDSGGAASGTGALSLPGITVAASGAMQPDGQAALTLPSLTIAATAAEELPGSGALAVPAAEVSASAAMQPAGAAALAIPSAELAAVGVTGEAAGDGAIVLSAAQVAAAAALQPDGQAALSLSPAAIAASAAAAGAATAVLELSASQIVASAAMQPDGQAALTLGAASIAASALETMPGVAALTLSAAQVAAASQQQLTGAGVLLLPVTALAAIALESNPGAAALTLPAVVIASAGSLPVTLDWLVIEAAGLYPALAATVSTSPAIEINARGLYPALAGRARLRQEGST